jgi:hypothetical protein
MVFGRGEKAVRIDEQVWSVGWGHQRLPASNVSQNSGVLVVKTHTCDTGITDLPAPVLHGRRFDFLRGFGCETISPIFGDRLIDDCSAVDAFPGIEGQKKVRESFQHHQSFALRAIHDYCLPREVNERAQGNSN